MNKTQMFGTAVTITLLMLVISPIQIGFSVLPSSYRNSTTLINDTLSWESQYPSLISHQQIGATVNGKPLYVFKIGNPNGGKVIIDAAIHGSENVGSEAVWWFMNWLLTSSDQNAVDIRQRDYVMVVPILNIDEFQIRRENAHMVDLNRNYQVGWGAFNDPERGSAALSEPESQAMFNFVSGLHLALSDKAWYINIHVGDERASPPWGYLSYTPEQSYYQAVYANYSRLCSATGSIPFAYKATNNYGGGLARDQMYALGAYSFTVEVSTSFTPTYSTIPTTILGRLEPLLITVCQEAAVTIIGEKTLTLDVSGTGSTTPSIGSHSYAPGTVVPITITSGTLQRWYLDGIVQNTASISVTMNQNHAVIIQLSSTPPGPPNYALYALLAIVIVAAITLPVLYETVLRKKRR